jgi:hypothetical protein
VDLPKMSGTWRYYVSSDDDAMPSEVVIAIPIPYQRLTRGRREELVARGVIGFGNTISPRGVPWCSTSQRLSAESMLKTRRLLIGDSCSQTALRSVTVHVLLVCSASSHARHLMSCSVEQFAPTVGLDAVGVAVEVWRCGQR